MATSKGIGHDVRFPLPNGLRHGQGKRVWANGATYDGRHVIIYEVWTYEK